jgi:hypothetical protein
MAVISTSEQFRGVSYARDSLASWRAAQRDYYRGFVWRVLADRILRKTSRVVETDISSRVFRASTLGSISRAEMPSSECVSPSEFKSPFAREADILAAGWSR